MYSINFKKFENTDKFRPAAIHFGLHKYYTAAPRGTTAYREYWDEERRRSLYGYTAPDGEFISGYNYFYLNYCEILLLEDKLVFNPKIGKSQIKQLRTRNFPNFYDYDKYFFDIIEECERLGKHLAVLKSRRKGYSFKIASMLCRNYFLIPDSKGFALASNSEYLVRDGLLSKAWEMMAFIDENTAWAKKRQKTDTKMHKRASLVVDKGDGVKIELGYKSEIIGVSLGNDPQASRGKAGKLIVFEEAGSFPHLKTAWQVAQPSVEQGSSVHGLMIVFGCVCKGTKIFKSNGDIINIEDLSPEDRVLGYNTYSTVEQNIEKFREPYDIECIKITTISGRSLSCTLDHPIIYSHRTLSKRVPGRRSFNEHMKSWKWKEAKDFKVGDQVGTIASIPFWGNKEIWNPRLIGWLIGDGSYGKDKTPRLSNCEDEINNYIDEHFDTVIEKQHITKTGKIYRETRIRQICFRLRELGIYEQVKENKRLPSIIFNSTKKDTCELLGGLFDTDGYVTNPDKQLVINLTSAYKELLLEVQLLLQKLDIHAKIHFIKPYLKNPKDRNGYYRLSISDIKSLSNFVSNVELFPKVKKERINRYKTELLKHTSETSKYISGLRFERIISIENIGIQTVYNFQTNDTHTYIANGIVTHNTGGTENADFEGLKDIFYEPSAYNCLEIENVWSEGATKPCGFYVPYTAHLEGNFEGKMFIDDQGNSLFSDCKKYVLSKRKEVIDNASDRTIIDRYIAERSLTPEEASLNISTNIFPKDELLRHLTSLRNSTKLKEFKQVGDLMFGSNGEVIWTPTSHPRDHTTYRLPAGVDKHGQVVIWEHPITDAPWGLYVAGVDPYDHDKSTTDSLLSCFIYKRTTPGYGQGDILVAEYTGRPDTAEEAYEIVRLLSIYYHCSILYENQCKGMFPYFTHKHSDYLLADQPDIIKDIVKNSTVQRTKGTHMSKEIKIWAEGKTKEWLNTEISPGIKRLTTINSEALIEEFISYNDEGNFDRAIAFFLLMIYLEELYHLQVKKRTTDANDRLLFKEPLFDIQSFNF